jgi:signal transduction histidine kinase/CheY-like chemotaxis protein
MRNPIEVQARAGRGQQLIFAATFFLATATSVAVYWQHFHSESMRHAEALTRGDFNDALAADVERVRNDFAESFQAVQATAAVAGLLPVDQTPRGLAAERSRTAAAARGQLNEDVPTRAIYMTVADPAGVVGVVRLTGDAVDDRTDAALTAVIRLHQQRLCTPAVGTPPVTHISSGIRTAEGCAIICSAPYGNGDRPDGIVSAICPAAAFQRDLDPSFYALVHPTDGDDGVVAAPVTAAAIGAGWADVRRGTAPALSPSTKTGYAWSGSVDVPGSDPQRWRVVAAVPTAAFYATTDFGPVRSEGNRILIGGFAACGLMTGLVWILSTGRARAVAVARSMVVELTRATATAEAATRSKSEFLAHMSHEIRTPLNGVAGMFDLLRGTELTPIQARYARVGRDAADALMHVINDILDFSKIEAGKVEIEAIEFDLGHLVGSLLELLEPIAKAKGLRLASELPAGLPRRSAGDPTRLRQVLTNLISNAIKFTPAGTVSVRAAIGSGATEDPTVVRLEVVDTGMGIPADRLHRLFESFSQVDASTSRRFGGTGLGLAISKRLVELMGGQIGVRSEVGRGTTFWFTVRLGVAQAVPAPPPLIDATGRTGGLHLLVADDNEINRFLAGELLRRSGHTCDLVEDGEAAVNAAAAGSYDAILMDCQMPTVDGLEATRQIRRREGAGQHVPILALTAEAIDGDRERCLAAGMDGYVTKPIDVRMLMAALNAVTGASIRRAA